MTLKTLTTLLLLLAATCSLAAQNIIPLPARTVKGKKLVAKTQPTLLPFNDTLPSEGYKLIIGEYGTFIEPADSAGLFYAQVTLSQLPDTLTQVVITDFPRLPYRGMMIDVSRHFFPISFLKKQIQAMAQLKLNRLHLHLTDAAGWRLQIDRYPRLTRQAAFRPQRLWKDWNAQGKQYSSESDTSAYGGYYTKDQIKDLVAFAAKHHVQIIPEIEMPSHSEEVTTAYPYLSCSPDSPGDFCPGKESTYHFLQDVLTEVMDLFPSEVIHIGGDESSHQAWKSCPDCQRAIKEHNLKDEDALQAYFINRIAGFLRQHGRRMMGWDEILTGDALDSTAVVMVWRGMDNVTKAAQGGNPVVLTPGGFCYFDAYQDAPYSQPQAFGGYLPLSHVYSLNPRPDSLANVIGLQGNIFSEYIPTESHAEYMLYPRIYAIAEAAWTPQQLRDSLDFRNRALDLTYKMKQQGYNPFDLHSEIGNKPESLITHPHLALGKPVTYNVPWWDWYPAQSEKTLTDGLLGGWNYSDQRWQGFLYKDDQRLDVTIDLQRLTPIREIEVEFMQFQNPGVWFPENVQFLESPDGINFQPLQSLHHTQIPDESLSFKTFKWHGQASTRYIRVQATSPQGCLFTSEIIVN